MEDLDVYRKFIECQAPYGYALLFRNLGDFDLAQAALEKAFVEGYPTWALHPPATDKSAAFMARLTASPGVEDGPAPTARPEGLLLQSQKLQALDSALDLLRSFPGDHQVALVLLHVEEAAPDQILSWLGRDPSYLESVGAELKERLARWNPPLATHGEPAAFFLRALRQHRLSAQFSTTVLEKLKRSNPGWNSSGRLIGWGLLAGIPLLLLPRMTEHYIPRGYYYDYESERNRLWQLGNLLSQLSIDFFLTLSAFLQNRYLLRHAPPALLKSLTPGLRPLLDLLAKSGFGLLICETLVLLNVETIRGLTQYPWIPIHTLWSLTTIALVLMGAYQTALHYFKQADAGGGS